MWIRLPKGTKSISLHQQNYTAEAKTKVGKETFDYVRIPDHFWPTLQMVGGYIIEDPEGVDEDSLAPVPGAKPNDGVAQLALQLQAVETELKTANEELGTLKAENLALKSSVEDGQRAIEAANDQLAGVLKELDNKGYDLANIPVCPKEQQPVI